MKPLRVPGRSLAVIGVVVPLLALLGYVALRSGPLAPVAVTVATVESRALTPALFGIGAVESRYTYKIGPTFAGRLKRLDVEVGDRVRAGQRVGEMDAVDLDDRVRAQAAAVKRAEAALREAAARQAHAATQARRYEDLFAARSTSEETVATKRQESEIADAALSVAREEIVRARADHDALQAQRQSLRLVAPVDGVVVARDADPGSTLVAGQVAVEVVDPKHLWLNVRFDQIAAAGLAAGLPARVALRSRRGQLLAGRVLRVEAKADAVTEEMLAKVVVDPAPARWPAIGELAEVTVDLPPLAATPVIANAALRRDGGGAAVWQIVAGDLRLTAVKLGVADLDGAVQILDGLKDGDRVVLHSDKALTAKSRVKIVDRLAGTAR